MCLWYKHKFGLVRYIQLSRRVFIISDKTASGSNAACIPLSHRREHLIHYDAQSIVYWSNTTIHKAIIITRDVHNSYMIIQHVLLQIKRATKISNLWSFCKLFFKILNNITIICAEGNISSCLLQWARKPTKKDGKLKYLNALNLDIEVLCLIILRFTWTTGFRHFVFVV